MSGWEWKWLMTLEEIHQIVNLLKLLSSRKLVKSIFWVCVLRSFSSNLTSPSKSRRRVGEKGGFPTELRTCHFRLHICQLLQMYVKKGKYISNLPNPISEFCLVCLWGLGWTGVHWWFPATDFYWVLGLENKSANE